MDRVLMKLKDIGWEWGWWLDDGKFVSDSGRTYGYAQIEAVYGGDYLGMVSEELGGDAKLVGETVEAAFEYSEKNKRYRSGVTWKNR